MYMRAFPGTSLVRDAPRTIPRDRSDLDIGTLSGVYSQRDSSCELPLTRHQRLIMLMPGDAATTSHFTS